MDDRGIFFKFIVLIYGSSFKRVYTLCTSLYWMPVCCFVCRKFFIYLFFRYYSWYKCIVVISINTPCGFKKKIYRDAAAPWTTRNIINSILSARWYALYRKTVVLPETDWYAKPWKKYFWMLIFWMHARQQHLTAHVLICPTPLTPRHVYEHLLN